MDTSDPEISFDDDGVCNHCCTFRNATVHSWFPNDEGARRLEARVAQIKEESAGKEYDCILGLSGGVDSSYLALKVRDLGLRPLVVHVDAGWNSETAVSNIEQVVRHCRFTLHTHVMDWDEMADLQLAYLRAGVANQDVPQDHAFFANLYQFAIKNGIRTVLSGGNIATESVFPEAWHGSAMDAVNLKAIHRKWGSRPLRHYRTISFSAYYLVYPLLKRLQVLRPLNFMPYSRANAIQELEASCGWRSYGRKHGESLFTRFFQNHFLPVKFGYDKRRPHFSSMILSGQMTREDAVSELDLPLYSADELKADREFFCKKLGITEARLDELMAAPNGHYSDYPNWDTRYARMKRMQAMVERALGRRVNAYS
jgi:N-acetyl sugar amidotransferase